MTNVAILDDYQGVSLTLADWKLLPADAHLTVFRDNITDQAAVVRRLQPFDVLCVMRERTPLPRAVLQQLPNPRLIGREAERVAQENDRVYFSFCHQRTNLQIAPPWFRF